MWPEMYPKKPVPWRWRSLPEAFIGELNIYYAVTQKEIKILHKEGFIEIDSCGCRIEDVPVWQPVETDDAQVTPEQIEARLEELRSKC